MPLLWKAKSSRAAVCATAFGVLMAAFVSAQSYSVVDVGTPGGFTNSSGAYSLAHGINGAGAVAGEWAPNNASQRPFLYAGGTNTDIGLLPGTQYGVAEALNTSNQVVGEMQNTVGDTYAFLYTNGVMVNLTPNLIPPPGFAYSLAHAINDAGEIVGESYVSTSEIHAVIFRGNRSISNLGVLSNGDYSAAFGINRFGLIVGESTVISGGVTNVYAFVYSNGTMTALGTLGGNYSAAFGVNDAGQIVGESDNALGQTHAFLWQNGAMSDLGTLGGNTSSAQAINNRGMIVGYATTTNGQSHAFVCDGTAMRDLNDLIDHSVCSNLVSANGINDAGQIAASGYTTNNVFHAFLLTPALTPTLELGSPVRTNGQFQFTVEGAPGWRIIVQNSTDLLNWVAFYTNTLTSNSWLCTDTNAPDFPSRFYRALLSP